MGGFNVRLVPVLDLMGGVVVHGRSGRRDEYRPLVTPWAADAEPLSVARGLTAAYGFREFYVADLDAIIDGRPNAEIWRSLRRDGYRLFVDAGVAEPAAARAVTGTGAVPIVGLESCPSPVALRSIVEATEGGNVVFSLDLVAGKPKTTSPAWPVDPHELARDVMGTGVRRLIVLDLAGVGMSEGVRHLDLLVSLRSEFPDCELITGGGVRGPADLEELASAGVAAVLVASALHNGRLPPEVAGRWIERSV